MTDSDLTRHAVEWLAAARLGGGPTERMPDELMPQTIEEGYALQHRLNAHLTQAGFGPVVGHKIGCTTQVMQEYMKIDQPCAGEIFATMEFHEQADVQIDLYHRIGIEVEIGALLSHDLTGEDRFDRGSVGGYVEAVLPAVELVDDRYVDYPSLPVPMLIADNFFNSGAVLGAPVLNWDNLDLGAVSGTLYIDGEEAGSGSGADILGHPFEALAWLANLRQTQDRPLRAGEFVLLGSIVKTVHFDAPARCVADLGELGRIEVNFT
ncbi:MAG: fumarylacetoacetate hydrolase family protein [Nisaea sp.]|jgi:2-oxo-3-hexenedioate decarboxylase/2-keto-4-pentenoate hydratase|uniref:2-keto-4-pentenoate hydratase n=1 Tax=Nisaea sp. TaxID=2024842 RepID=UPI001B017B96|nr:fumarylacetoacetate hydrolase family protein [Nisaea sp.]MBO6560689.1 fumarylacetoacetate hydrolase family protein [Nisaea sp.]